MDRHGQQVHEIAGLAGRENATDAFHEGPDIVPGPSNELAHIRAYADTHSYPVSHSINHLSSVLVWLRVRQPPDLVQRLPCCAASSAGTSTPPRIGTGVSLRRRTC